MAFTFWYGFSSYHALLVGKEDIVALVGYARVSTRGQSLDAQLNALHDCDKVFKEIISGAKDNRAELTALLDYVREGDTVKVTKLDRLARNTKHLLEISDYLEAKQVRLFIMNIGIDTGTPTGKLMLTMIGAIATFEREIMLERQAEGIALAKQQGKYTGRKASAMAKSNEVLSLLAQGATKPEISRQLDISITSIYRIINNQNRFSL